MANGQRRKSAPEALERRARGLADRKDNDRLMDSLPCPPVRPSRKRRNENYDRDGILDALRARKPYKAIATEFNVSRSLISRIAIENGLRQKTVRSTAAPRPCDAYVRAESAALVGGQWVRRGLIWVWTGSGAA